MVQIGGLPGEVGLARHLSWPSLVGRAGLRLCPSACNDGGKVEVNVLVVLVVDVVAVQSWTMSLSPGGMGRKAA